MTDPVTTAATYGGAFLIGVAGSLLGQQYGPVVVMAGGGMAGALISLGEVETRTRLDAIWYVLRFSLAAVFVSGALARLMAAFVDIESVELLGLVAFLFGLIGGRWKTLLGLAVAWVQKFTGRAGGDQP